MSTTSSTHLREQLRCLVHRKAGIGEIDLGRFKQLRVRLGLTQSELAGVVGVDRTALTAWERGTKNPTPEHAKKLAVLLDEMERLVGEHRR